MLATSSLAFLQGSCMEARMGNEQHLDHGVVRYAKSEARVVGDWVRIRVAGRKAFKSESY